MATQPKDTRQFLEKRDRELQKTLDTLFEKANSDCSKIIQMIISEFQPSRIVQWGSLLKRKKISEISDIDIVVHSNKAFKNWGHIPGTLIYNILKEGKILYEKT